VTTNKSSNIQGPFDHRWVYVIFGILIFDRCNSSKMIKIKVTRAYTFALL
jgi:hypothetical protein